MKQEPKRNLEREISARFGIPAPTIVSQLGQGPAVVMSRLSCEEFAHGASEPAEPEDAYVLHVMLRDVEIYDLHLKGRRVTRAPAASGGVFLSTLRHQPVANLQTPFDLVRIYVPQSALEDHAGSTGLRRPVALHMIRQGSPDPVLSHLIRAVLPVFGAAFHQGQLFIDSISLAIQDHLLRAYGSGNDERRGSYGGLPPWLERRAKEFIESRLTEGVSLEDVAGHCNLSPSHFSKAFRISTGRPPHRWLLECRIELAKTLLMNKDRALTEVAALCGFSDASHFSRTFSQLTREPPASWRRRNRD